MHVDPQSLAQRLRFVVQVIKHLQMIRDEADRQDHQIGDQGPVVLECGSVETGAIQGFQLERVEQPGRVDQGPLVAGFLLSV